LKTAARIALVGDFNPEVLAHQAIQRSFDLGKEAGLVVDPVWTGTESLKPGDDSALKQFSGIWCVPASPYRNTEGALWGIQFARSRGVPFLGTCGGYQHALLEYALNVLGLKEAEHAEINAQASLPLLSRMQCTLVEKSQKVVVTSSGRFREIYGADDELEGYHCSYGLNRDFQHLFNGTELEVVARSEDGESRAVMLRGHPFFVGTHFQPERAALKGSLHPVVQAFFEACVEQLAKGKNPR
jgi:CTP synthase (UTP-ammonia lyase)